MRPTGICLFLGLLVLVYCKPVYAEAFRITQQGAAAAGQAGAFSAQADDPSAIYYNPAGMTRLPGIQTAFGTSLISGRTEFEGSSGGRTNGDLDGDIAWPPPSYLYLTGNLENSGIDFLDRFSLGVGVFSPYGLRVRYPDPSPLATAAIFGSLPLIDIRPVLGFEVNEQLSIAFGLDIYTFSDLIANGETQIRFRNPGIPGLPANAMLDFRGEGTALGFDAGILYSPLSFADGRPQLNLAFMYQHSASLNLAGDFRVNNQTIADADATLNLPRVYTFGVAFWPVRDADSEWKLEVDLDYSEWETFTDLDIHLDNGATLPFPQNWESSLSVKLGTEFKWINPGLLPAWDVALRGGYGFSETPVPDRTFTPLVADANFHTLAFGIGLTCRTNGHFLGLIPCSSGSGDAQTGFIGLDLSYQAVFLESRQVTGNLNPRVNGRYDTFLHIGTLSLRVGF